MSTFAKIEFNADNLFSLSYSFEGIKVLLSALAKNQQMLIERIEALENKETLPQSTRTNDKNGLTIDSRDDSATKKKDIQRDVIKEDVSKENSSISPDNTLRDRTKIISGISNADADNINGLNNDFLLDDYGNRILALENQMKRVTAFLPKGKNDNFSDIISEIQFNISSLNDKAKDSEEKLEKISTGFEEIKVKLSELNIYEMFKDSKVDGGSIDVTKVLVQNLEEKMFKKFSLIDGHIKKNEIDISKNKNDVSNLLNQSSNVQRNINQFKEDIGNINNNINNLTNDFNEKLSKIQKLSNALKEKVKSEIKDLREKQKSMGEELENAHLSFDEKDIPQPNTIVTPQQNYVTERDFARTKENLLKKIYDLDKKFIVFTSDINIDSINEQLDKLNKLADSKASSQEVYNISEKVQHIFEISQSYKETESNLMNEFLKVKKEISGINRKLEEIENHINLLKAGGNNADLIKAKIDMAKMDTIYLQIEAFKSYVKSNSREFERIQKNFDDFKRSLVDMNETIKEKCTENELKNLEDYIVSLIEELKESFMKKFANRLDVNRNFKSIETQIKEIMKNCLDNKEDKSDNWMLAKKPLGGHICASCESYIGDLNEKVSYLPWNKIPSNQTLQFDRTIKVGRGFSRFLNMLNLEKENTNTKTEVTVTENFHKTEPDNGGEQKQYKKNVYSSLSKNKPLPPIMKTEDKGKDTDNNPYTTDDRFRDENQPKVMKIYKVKKDSTTQSNTLTKDK